MKAALQTPARELTKPSFMPANTGLLQRKCACGGASGITAECTECSKNRLSLQRATGESDLYTQASEGVPSRVDERRRSFDQPLNAGTGAFVQSRFGHDFSQMRVDERRVIPLAATRSTTVSRDGDVETRTQLVGPRPAILPAGPAGNHCALTAATFTSIPSGTVAATLIGGLLQAPFVMRATFDNAIPCNCSNGEYRQYVRGSLTAGGTPIAHMLGPGRPLSATAFQEDGDVAAGTVYGHRSILGTGSRFLPDQQGGCQFEGEDAPGINSSSGTVVVMDLEFRGDLIDTSDSNRVMTTRSWGASGSATIP